VRAPEPLSAIRVIADQWALDDLSWPEATASLRLGPDDLLVIGATRPEETADNHAIVEDETGLVGWWLTAVELTDLVLPHVEWPLPADRPALAQGLVAGVPAKVWLAEDRALLLCPAAYAHELVERLG
jgi:hypothetical protein